MAPLSILVLVAILPIILICLYVYNKDRDKEPTKLLVKLFFLGILSCSIVLAFSFLTSFIPFLRKDVNDMSLIGVLIYSFVEVALVEEFVKWIMVYNFGYKSKHFDQLYDIVVYSVFVSLGFAFLENILYVLPQGLIRVGVVRAFLAVPGHASNAIFMGYFLSLARIYKNKDEKISKRNIFLSILVPTILHGIYDFCLFASIPILVIIFFFFVMVLYAFALSKLNTISKEFIREDNLFCKNCGALLEGNFCPKCGMMQQSIEDEKN